MQIFVKTPLGGTETYEIEGGEQVSSLQKKIFEREAVPVESQKLYFQGRKMTPESSMSEFDLQNGS